MRHRIYIILIFIVANGILFGNSVASKSDLTMFLDSYQYQGISDSTIVELSYSIDLSYLKYVDESDGAIDIDWDAAGNAYILQNGGGGVAC